jgi:phosphate uptake regulator
MESRKVQLAGQSTYTISLPKEWARAQGIETGQQLTLCPRDSGRLIISTERATDAEPPMVDVSTATPAEARELLEALYAAGFDEFGVRGEAGLETSVRRAVTQAATKLVGLEVAAEDEHSIRCRDLLDSAEVSLARVLSRLQFAALSAHRGATTGLSEGEGEHTERATRYRRDAAAECALLERRRARALTEVGRPEAVDVTRTELAGYTSTGEALDRVGDVGADLATAIEDGEPLPPESWCTEFSNVAQRTRLFVERAVSAVTAEPTVEQARSLAEERSACLEAVETLDERADTPETRLGYRALDALERTVEAGSEVRTAVLRMAVGGTE